MELSLYNIYESLILEGADITNDIIIDSINKPFRVKILYQGEDEQIAHERFIDPYVLGMSTAGNEIIRAFYSFGYSQNDAKKQRNMGSWKTYRKDRILRWTPTKYNIGKKPIEAYGVVDDITGISNIKSYKLDNLYGDPSTQKASDKKMVHIVAFRKFDLRDIKDKETIQKNNNLINKVDNFNKANVKNYEKVKQSKVQNKPIPPIEPIMPEPEQPLETNTEPQITQSQLPPIEQPKIIPPKNKNGDINKKI